MKVLKTERLANGNLLVSIPIYFGANAQGSGRRIVVPDGAIADGARELFLKTVARGRRWQRLIDEGTVADMRELGAKVGREASYVARIIRLANIAPSIIEDVINGKCHAGISVNVVRKAIPDLWEEQVKLFCGGK